MAAGLCILSMNRRWSAELEEQEEAIYPENETCVPAGMALSASETNGHIWPNEKK
jgi:transposase